MRSGLEWFLKHEKYPYQTVVSLSKETQLIYLTHLNRIKEEDLRWLKEKRVIAEFISPQPSDSLYRWFGLEGTGWRGRYFHNLRGEEAKEVMKSSNFTGAGFVFIHNKKGGVVLEEIKDLRSTCFFVFSKEGKNLTPIQGRIPYGGWVEVVKIKEGDLLGYYHLDLTYRGIQKLAKLGISPFFPAVVCKTTPSHTRYYFAGDFSHTEPPSVYRVYGLDTIFGLFDRNNTFYWKVYVPLMRAIL